MKAIVGKVVSTKMTNTIVVEVGRQLVHPLYKKILRRTKRYKVHNEDAKVKEGDIVQIMQIRPESRDKHYKFVKIIK